MTSTGGKDSSSRVEREVLEILERAEASQTPVDNLQDNVRRQRAAMRAQLSQSQFDTRLRPLLSGAVVRIIGALLLAAAAAVTSNVSGLLAFILAIASALLFFSLWLPTRGPNSGSMPRWRGQDLRGPGFPRGRNGPPKPPR